MSVGTPDLFRDPCLASLDMPLGRDQPSPRWYDRYRSFCSCRQFSAFVTTYYQPQADLLWHLVLTQDQNNKHEQFTLQRHFCRRATVENGSNLLISRNVKQQHHWPTQSQAVCGKTNRFTDRKQPDALYIEISPPCPPLGLYQGPNTDT